MEVEILEVPVLIIGAGPSGATLALLLAQHGIHATMISRHSGTANTPRAHIFNQRAMEVFRDAGLEKILMQYTSSSKAMMHSSWLRELGGEEYGRLWAWGNRPDRMGEYEAASPCVMSDLPQSRLEPILVKEAQALGTDVRFFTEFVSQSVMSGNRIRTRVRRRQDGQEYDIISNYLIGADGARSAVLESLDIPIDGEQLNTAFNVHIKADLTRYIAHRPGSLNWVLNPDAPEWSAVGNFRMVHPWDEFVVSMHPASKDGKPFEPTESDIIQRLHQMIGDGPNPVPIKILSQFRWTINNQVARSWQRDNVICIGDAVHRHPPINGLGSNTCVSDAMNLAWKLAYVIKGLANPLILDSVTSERKSVGDQVVKRANEGMEDHRKLWAVIGLTQAEREICTSTMAQATTNGQEMRSRFRAALEKTDDELNALGIQMNQIYLHSELTVVEPDDMAPNFSHLDLVKTHAVSSFPGYHLPHVWIAKDGQSERVSSLDIVGHGSFTLITGIGGELWHKAVQEINQNIPALDMKVLSIGWRQDYIDAYRDWQMVRGVNDDGAVLVRPDHFVTWRCRNLPANPSQKLREVMRRVLGNND